MGAYISAIHWAAWGRLVIISIIAVFGLVVFVVFPLLILAASYFERLTLRKLDPADASATKGKNEPVVDAALCAGLQNIGTFMDRRGQFMSGGITMLLSADGLILLAVVHSRVGRYSLTTRLQSGRRIRTADVSGVRDLSGLEDQQMLPGVPLEVVIYYHQQRVAAAEEPATPFDPASLADEEYTFQRERVARMVQMGLARYRDPEQTSWSYSMQGAWQLAWQHVRTASNVKQQSELAKAKAAEFTQWRIATAKSPMRSQSIF